MTLPANLGLHELQEQVVDELTDKLVDELTFAVQSERIHIAADGPDAWVEATEFADRCRAAYLSALERVRETADE